MTPLYGFAKTCVAPFIRLFGYKVEGKENIPPMAKMVIAANHTSYCDPVLVGLAFPQQVHFLAKSEFSKRFFFRKLFSALGVIFINRDEADISALRKALAVLKEEKSLGIFPEGRRFKDGGLTDFKQGPAFIAYKGHAAVVPVGLINASGLFKFWQRRVIIRIGKPIIIDDEGGTLKTHEIMDKYTPMIKNAIAELSV